MKQLVKVQDNEETLELLLLGNYPIYDGSQISLKVFIRFKVDNIIWGRSPTRYGRLAFLDAFTNFQKVLVVYFGNDLSTCCEDIIEILIEEKDVLQNFNDSFIQVKLEMAISLFYQNPYLWALVDRYTDRLEGSLKGDEGYVKRMLINSTQILVTSLKFPRFPLKLIQ